MEKKAQFFIDDVLWVFRDLTREKPASLFDNAYMAMLKKAHDDYGVKTQLNLFYNTSSWYGADEFSLAEMTDAYKAEFKVSSSWLKLAFHAKEEWPDYPYVNADYELVHRDFNLIKNEVIRFAGEDSFAYNVVPHWAPISKEGVLALRDNGVKSTYSTYGEKQEWNGDQSVLPYGHSFRLMHNKKPESGIYQKITRDKAVACALCSYNHVNEEDYVSKIGKLACIPDKETGMNYTPAVPAVLNLIPLDILEQELGKFTHYEFLGVGNHEQYFYPDYYAYQKDYAEKIYTMGKVLKDAGYTFIFADERV